VDVIVRGRIQLSWRTVEGGLTADHMMERRIQPELLDELPKSDPHAQRSRVDLRRVNAWMGNARILANALRSIPTPVRRIVEIGAGDGTLLLDVAARLGDHCKNTEVVLLDRQSLVTKETMERYHRFGWRVQAVEGDVFELLASDEFRAGDVVVANLFLHHFNGLQLRKLFDGFANQTDALIACEPYRSRSCLAFTKLLRLIGCNHVTRHDAAVSVAAGFRDHELSSLWPESQNWHMLEKSAGGFSHLFCVSRKDPNAAL
jgi:hypothetical protein